MSFTGKFSRVIAHSIMGVPIYSFELKNTNLFQSERVDIMLSDGACQRPWYFRGQKIKAGQSLVFNLETVKWEWCNGDFCAILGKNDKIVQRWDLRFKIYGPGECPECHGTHKCRHCNGQGYSLNTRTVEISQCSHCSGTGVCQTCYVPQRRPSYSGGGFLSDQGGGPGTAPQRANPRQIAAIQNEIADLQNKLNREEWDIRRMEADGSSVRHHGVYQSHLQLRYTYSTRLIQLQNQLQQMI